MTSERRNSMSSEPVIDHTHNAAPAVPDEPHKCSCDTPQVPHEQFGYAMGRIDVRFPSMGIEREFQQREMRLGEAKETLSRGERMARVLEANHHLPSPLCYILSMTGIPPYILPPPPFSHPPHSLQHLSL